MLPSRLMGTDQGWVRNSAILQELCAGNPDCRQVTENPVFKELLRKSTTPKALLLPDWRQSTQNVPVTSAIALRDEFVTLRLLMERARTHL